MYEFIPSSSRVPRDFVAGMKCGFKFFSPGLVSSEKMGEFIDAHTHIQFSAYDEDRSEVIERARKEKIVIVNVGTQKSTSESAIKLAHKHADVYATVGLHPIHTSRSFYDAQELGGGNAAKAFTPLEISRSKRLQPSAKAESGFLTGFMSHEEKFDYDYYKNLALDEKVIAIGECGLDHFHLQENIPDAEERQKKAFIEQIKLSRDVKKPLMIHCRDAFPDLIEILKSNNSNLLAGNPGIIHFFSGTENEARELLDMGFYFTFGGAITYQPKKNGVNYEAIIKIMPMERILSETDAPYVAPAPYRGKRNEPIYVIETVKKLAAFKQVSLETMKKQILKNAEIVFNFFELQNK